LIHSIKETSTKFAGMPKVEYPILEILEKICQLAFNLLDI